MRIPPTAGNKPSLRMIIVNYYVHIQCQAFSHTEIPSPPTACYLTHPLSQIGRYTYKFRGLNSRKGPHSSDMRGRKTHIEVLSKTNGNTSPAHASGTDLLVIDYPRIIIADIENLSAIERLCLGHCLFMSRVSFR